ncbi:LAFE_0D06832g1_1 [Lachancea fermentati]|uniref:Ribonuclease H n=1 Tax=Lachancea fermentati TaxID=4955 RepID=A0A1G4MBJ3_LACFM|nr:LAFE_0D06832g1_1 [Lachancea fermentati]
MAKKAFYAVRRGRALGIYDTWDQCKTQIYGYQGAQYKKFSTLSEAQDFIKANSPNYSDSRLADESSRKSHLGKGKLESKKGYAAGVSKHQGPRYYSVKSGNPSILSKVFTSWPECQKYVSGKRGLTYQKFNSQKEALNFIAGISTKDYELISITEGEFKSKYKIKDKDKKFEEHSNVYCDGSAIANGTSKSRAGYGVFFESTGECIAEPLTSGPPTNNRAEIQAVSAALGKIWEHLTIAHKKIKFTIKTDSEYVSKLLNDRYMTFNNEKMKTIENGDLISPLVEKFVKVKKYYEINGTHFIDGGKFEICWVKGHAGEPGNEKADELAKRGADKYILQN